MVGAHRHWRCLRVALLLSAALLAAPAVAGACPNVNRVQSFNGTMSLSYQRTMTASDGHGGTETLTLNHTARGLNVAIALVYPALRPPYWQGSTSGGNVTVDDVFDDMSSTGTDTHGQQVANGPADAANVFAGLDFDSARCTYAILAGAGIATVTTGSGPHDQSVGDQVMSGLHPLPADLDLSGTITVPAFVNLNAAPNSTPSNGWYQFGDNSSWGAAMGTLTGAGVTQSVGQATFSWNVTPTFLPPANPVCEVPKLEHVTLKAAKRALRRAGCRLGKVTRRRSSRVTKGHVISTRPPAFTAHKLHTKVALTVSTGKKR